MSFFNEQWAKNCYVLAITNERFQRMGSTLKERLVSSGIDERVYNLSVWLDCHGLPVHYSCAKLVFEGQCDTGIPQEVPSGPFFLRES